MTAFSPITLVECPRDAMQGWPSQIPTDIKIEYLQQLLKAGFQILDCGSFVSPKAIPQMADTASVIRALDLRNTDTRLLVIVANTKGAEEAVSYDSIACLGFPFSVSPTFQQRNTNSLPEQSLDRVREILELCLKNGKELVVYLSMAFGNPYGDEYSEQLVLDWAHRLHELGVSVLSLADTVGLATPKQVDSLTGQLIQFLPDTQVGVHLHARPDGWREKLEAAWNAGCRRFDGALKGIGGCPMAKDELVGNMDTERMIQWFRSRELPISILDEELQKSLLLAGRIFS